MKRCKRCLTEKEPGEFNKEPRVKDGLTAICRQCNGEVGAEWRANNRERFNETQQRWRNRHPEEALQKGRDWRTNNPERSRAFGRKWRRNNKEKVRARQQKWARENRAHVLLYAEERRARDAGAAGMTTPEQLQARIDYYGGLCWCCSVPFEAVDHVISLHKGGTNWPANLRPICKSCNSSKGAKHPVEFMRQRAEASE